MKSAQVDVKEYKYFANNQWREAADKKFFEVHEPCSGNLFARVAAGAIIQRRYAGAPRKRGISNRAAEAIQFLVCLRIMYGTVKRENRIRSLA